MIGTAEQIAELMLKRRNLVEKEFRHSSNAIAKSARKFSKEKLSELYAIPEDRTKKGKKKWRRTGALRRGEIVEVPDAYTVRVVNRIRYAKPRHEAGKPGRRRINPLRENHWRDELKRVFRPIVRDVRRLTLIDILRATGTTVPEELL